MFLRDKNHKMSSNKAAKIWPEAIFIPKFTLTNSINSQFGL